MLPGQTPRIRRHSSSCSKRPRAYSTRCSGQGPSWCLLLRCPRGGQDQEPGPCKGFGGVGVVLGVIGVVAASVLPVDPLSKRLRWCSRTPRLPSRPGKEALQSVESAVGSFEDRREGKR